MTVLYLLLLLLGAVCFAMAMVGASVRNFNLVAAGLLFWVMVPLLQTVTSL